ncbi:unnamed protein product [Meloidogyne enterolobii]|uniref:Uncharacterized protein n=1 Tax=Meloidogyne enterolobii TaxID=390850 RepID=A0ACB0XRI7_MELEN
MPKLIFKVFISSFSFFNLFLTPLNASFFHLTFFLRLIGRGYLLEIFLMEVLNEKENSKKNFF